MGCINWLAHEILYLAAKNHLQPLASTAMMGFVNHIGHGLEKDLPPYSCAVKARGLVTLLVLQYLLIIIKGISFGSNIATLFFPETVRDIRRKLTAFFWDVCIYFIVSILLQDFGPY
jgi:hypothetical protein